MIKKYNIDSFERLANVINKDNVNRLSLDVMQVLHVYVKYVDEVRQNNPEETKNLTNSEIAKLSFEWLDDGKNDILGVKFTDAATGEEDFIESPKV